MSSNVLLKNKGRYSTKMYFDWYWYFVIVYQEQAPWSFLSPYIDSIPDWCQILLHVYRKYIGVLFASSVCQTALNFLGLTIVWRDICKIRAFFFLAHKID